MVVLLNKGLRTWHLVEGQLKDGKLVRRFSDKNEEAVPGAPVVKRSLLIGGSIEAIDEKEAKDLLGYSDIVDAEKDIKPVADKISALTKERDELKAQVAELEDRVKELEPEGGKKKGK